MFKSKQTKLYEREKDVPNRRGLIAKSSSGEIWISDEKYGKKHWWSMKNKNAFFYWRPMTDDR